MKTQKMQQELKKIQKILKQMLMQQVPMMFRDVKQAPRTQQWDVVRKHLEKMLQQVETSIKPSVKRILSELKVQMKSQGQSAKKSSTRSKAGGKSVNKPKRSKSPKIRSKNNTSTQVAAENDANETQ